MIELVKEQKKYKIAILSESVIKWVEDAVVTMSWNGSIREASRTMNIEILKKNGTSDFQVGETIVIYNVQGDELMRYLIIKKTKTSSGTSIKYMARDLRWWLTRSKLDRKFENMTASQIFSDLCKTLDIPIGKVSDTKVKFTVLHFTNKTPWDMIITALTETRKRTGKKYTTRVNKGKLELYEKVEQTSKWVIENGVNLLDATYEESIENTFTQIKVTGNDSSNKAISAIVKNEKAQKKYGIMQESIEQNDKVSQDELNKIAVQKLKELSEVQKSGSIKTFGIDNVESGGALYVIDQDTGLIGGFYIESDSHTYSNGYHEMSLTLAWTDELPSIEYDPPQSSSNQRETSKLKTMKQEKKKV